VSVAAATAVLSGFWGGLSLGRFLSGWIADRMDYYAYTIGCIVLASLSLIGAVIVPWLPLSALLFALTGMFFGPIFPMIMTLGGNIYPHRLAALGGSLTTAAVVGGLIYPPLMGILESRIGLSGGMIGAALLGIPMAGAVLFAQRTASQR
jgi:fucose permease